MKLTAAVLSAATVAATVLLALAPAPAGADTGSTVTVVGPAEIMDSGLFQHVIQPQFKAAFPKYTLKYNPSAIGTAVQSAEKGTGTPSVLIADDPSLENRFVSGGFSYQNRFGSAAFTSDYVVAGPRTDEVTAGAPHSAARAFADIAAAGVAGHATFLTRGGTLTAPGATVEEHAIWALVHSAGLTPDGVVLCTVSASDGGGMSPIDPAKQPRSGQACPDAGTVASPDNPDWYVINNVNQANNVVAANNCVLGSGLNMCYVLTGRGTFDYLLSGNDPAGTIPGLSILTRDDSASAAGGADELVNYFHAYTINPAKPGEKVNLQGSRDFVSFLTSPSMQRQLSTYLNTTRDSGGAPFTPDAAPVLTVKRSTALVKGGHAETVTGSVGNTQPGFPAVAGQRITVDRLVGKAAVPVKSALTDARGHYTIRFAPPARGSYQVATKQISQVEIASLHPSFGDLLAPAATRFSVGVKATVKIRRLKSSHGSVRVVGRAEPGAPDRHATVTLLARRGGAKAKFRTVGERALAKGHTRFALSGRLRSGTWTIKVRYHDARVLTAGTSAARQVQVRT